MSEEKQTLKIEVEKFIKTHHKMMKNKLDEHIPLVIVDHFFEGALFIQLWWNIWNVQKRPFQKRRKFYDGSWGKTIHTDCPPEDVTIDKDFFFSYVQGDKKYFINKSEVLAYRRGEDVTEVFIAHELPHINVNSFNLVNEDLDTDFFNKEGELVSFSDRIESISDKKIKELVGTFISEHKAA